MKTPEQIRNMEFQKSPMGGYKQSDVELFLEEMASEIEILMRQKAEADRRLKVSGRSAVYRRYSECAHKRTARG